MRRSKNGPALFELLGERGLRASENIDRNAGIPDAIALEEPPAETAPERERPRIQHAEPTDIGQPATVSVEGDRLHVSLTTVSAAAVAFVLLVLLAGAAGLGFRQGRSRGLADGYAAGRASYLAETESDIEAARRQAPSTYLVGGLLEANSPAGSPAPAPDRIALKEIAADKQSSANRWIDGYTYVVAQEFSSKNQSDVEPAQRFLAEHGVETAAVQISSGGTRLITTQGFDRKDPAQRKLADQLLEKVRAIGTQYFASGGRYKLEGYFKTLAGDG